MTGDASAASSSTLAMVGRASSGVARYPDESKALSGLDLHLICIIRVRMPDRKMLNVMDKFLAMGMPLDEVILRPWNPARKSQHEELGHLSVERACGRDSLAPGEGNLRLHGPDRRRLDGTSKLIAELTLRDGAVVYDLNGLTTVPWEKGLRRRRGRTRNNRLRRPSPKTSRKRRATIASSPGSSIHTPTTIVLSSVGSPAAGLRPVPGCNSMLARREFRRHVQWRISRAWSCAAPKVAARWRRRS